jgi:glycerol-3-phosphate O-acyltransferase
VTASPAPDTATETLVLADVGTDVERALVTDWIRETGVRTPGPLPATGPALAGPLEAAAPDADVLAVRVAWLPRERNGRRRVRVTDLLSLVDPRHPPARAQARIARREPDRAVVVVAEPASVGELRDRFAGHGAGGFGEFVARQARLALDRAERALVGGRYKVPKRIVEDIRASAQFRAGVAELAARLGRTPDDVAAAAGEDLDALVASMSPLAVDMLSGVLRPLHSRAWHVEVETSGLAELRELNRAHPLVFLPSHRSYADPLLLADVLAEHDFPRNHVLGGDNLRFWPLAPLARRAGIVFIRRSFGDDEVYKFAVREYFGFLLAKRFNLEWYMEGGRSRTGKLRPPRYGLLANVAEALDRGRAQDAYLVPVSITYAQLREVAAMAAEQRGAAKKGEGLSWLASYARAQLSPVGTAYVRFGLPISLRAALLSGAESGSDAAGGGRRIALQKVAFEVAVGINAVTPVIATSLVTLTLLGVRDRALTLPQVARVLRPVREYVLERGLPHAIELLDTEEGLRRVLAELTAERVVTTYTGGEEAVFAIERGQHLVAAFYRNSSIHHFVNRAIAELMLLCPPAERAAEAARLRDLLKFEFFFPDRATHAEQLAAELTRLGADGAGPEGRVLLEKAGFLIAHRVLRSFLDAQLVVARRLVSLGDRPPGPEKEFLDATAGLGQQLLLQGRLHGPESLSRELFASALRLADNQGLLDGADLAARRAQFAERVEDVVARVTTIDEIDAATRQEAAGVEP